MTFSEFWALVREDWEAHGRDWTKPGFRAIAVYRLGVWRITRHHLLAKLLGLLYWILFRRVRNVYGIEIPYSASVGRRVVFEHQGGIVIHGASIIGDDCIIRQGVTLGNRHLDAPDSAPTLGRNVNVGAGAVILGDVSVGDDSMVGANAVVLNDVESEATVVGIPAKPVGVSEALL